MLYRCWFGLTTARILLIPLIEKSVLEKSRKDAYTSARFSICFCLLLPPQHAQVTIRHREPFAAFVGLVKKNTRGARVGVARSCAGFDDPGTAVCDDRELWQQHKARALLPRPSAEPGQIRGAQNFT